MSFLDIGVIIVFSLAAVYFVVMFWLCRGWAKPKHPERRFLIGLMVSSLYTFWFIVIGMLILIVVW